MSMPNSKRGQELKPSMIVVLIILLFIAYLLLIPPEARDEILGSDNETTSSNVSTVNSNTLLSRSPGKINKIDQDSIEHPMPMLYLCAESLPQEIFYLNSFYTDRSFFSEKSNEVRFLLDNPEEVEKAYLSFKVDESKGITNIILNGYTIYSDKLHSGSINPIEIPAKYLQKENTLAFKLGKPFIFFKSKLKLNDLKIIANILKKDSLTAKTGFMLYEKEFNNLKSAKLYFITTCDINKVGKLTIKLNNQIVHESTPACNNLNVIEISQSRILEGENNLEFSLEKGVLKIDELKLVTKLKEASYPLYYFQVSKEQIDSLNSKDAILKVEFPDDLKNRRLIVNINGIKTDIETSDRIYTYKVNSFLREGNNYLKIEPVSEEVNILHLEIYISDN